MVRIRRDVYPATCVHFQIRRTETTASRASASSTPASPRRDPARRGTTGGTDPKVARGEDSRCPLVEKRERVGVAGPVVEVDPVAKEGDVVAVEVAAVEEEEEEEEGEERGSSRGSPEMRERKWKEFSYLSPLK